MPPSQALPSSHARIRPSQAPDFWMSRMLLTSAGSPGVEGDREDVDLGPAGEGAGEGGVGEKGRLAAHRVLLEVGHPPAELVLPLPGLELRLERGQVELAVGGPVEGADRGRMDGHAVVGEFSGTSSIDPVLQAGRAASRTRMRPGRRDNGGIFSSSRSFCLLDGPARGFFLKNGDVSMVLFPFSVCNQKRPHFLSRPYPGGNLRAGPIRIKCKTLK